MVQFLVIYWGNNNSVSIIKEKSIFIAVQDRCFSYHTEGNHIIKCEESDYSCQHEEADTRIMFHVFKTPSNLKNVTKSL